MTVRKLIEMLQSVPEHQMDYKVEIETSENFYGFDSATLKTHDGSDHQNLLNIVFIEL